MFGPIGNGIGIWGRRKAGFNPAAFGNLVAAYEATYGITLNGSAVSAWAPRWIGPAGAQYSAAQLALVQATAVQQPAYVANRGDGFPELLFSDLALKTLKSPNLGAAIGSSSNMVVVAQGATCLSATPQYEGILALVGSAGLLVYPNNRTGNIVSLDCYDSPSTQTLVGTGFIVGKRRPFIFGVSASQIRTRFDATATQATRNGTGKVSNDFWLGSADAGNPASSGISALWIFKSTTTSDAAMVAAMKTRFPDYG